MKLHSMKIQFAVGLRCPNGRCDKLRILHLGGPKIEMGTGQIVEHPWICPKEAP